MKKIKRVIYLLLEVVAKPLCLLLAGCKMGPNYYPPANDVSDEWIASSVVKAPISYDVPPPCWWMIFHDPILNDIIERAAVNNNDVLKAQTNIFQSRAYRQVAKAPLYPSVSADFDAFHVFLSKNGLLGELATVPAPATTNANPTQTPSPKRSFNIFNNFIDATWEIDLFGKTRRSVEAAQAGIESTIEQRNDTLVSLFAEIARNYIELRSSQIQKKLIEKNIEILKNTVNIMQKRYSAGYSNLLDLEQIEVQYLQAISMLPAITTTIYRSIFALSVLTGDLPEALLEELLPERALPEVPLCLSSGLRSDLLRRRPDVRIAERNLAQATANIGVAVASFFPTITLFGLAGYDSVRLSNLYASASQTAIYGGDISLPIFQGGKLIGNLRIAQAQTAALAFTYQQTVLNALRDTETALVAYSEDISTMKAIEKVVQSNERLYHLNEQRYTKGLINRLDELNSELILNNSYLSLLQSQTTTLLDLVILYKALGGGLEPFDLCTQQ